MNQLMLPHYPFESKEYKSILGKCAWNRRKLGLVITRDQGRLPRKEILKRSSIKRKIKYHNNPIKYRLEAIKYSRKNPEKIKESRKKFYYKNRDSILKLNKIHYQKIKLTVFQKIQTFHKKTEIICNGWKLDYDCKIKDTDMLTIEHSNGDGCIERKKGSRTLYYAIFTNKRKIDDLEILCFNCNFKRKVMGVYS